MHLKGLEDNIFAAIYYLQEFFLNGPDVDKGVRRECANLIGRKGLSACFLFPIERK
jgi:hypothetical protein